jgi:DNA-directed RNA polymerase subunit N (RpoN/RPB10)
MSAMDTTEDKIKNKINIENKINSENKNQSFIKIKTPPSQYSSVYLPCLPVRCSYGHVINKTRSLKKKLKMEKQNEPMYKILENLGYNGIELSCCRTSVMTTVNPHAPIKHL